MSLPPPSTALIKRLREEKNVLAEHVVEDMYADLFWTERFPTRGRTHSLQDIGFHIDYLIQAVEANDPSVLERYARWLQGVLTARGMCTLHLADSFGRLALGIGDSIARRYLGAARVALLYDGGAARAVQERIRDTITSGRPGAIEDVEYYLSYLSDAIVLGQPKLFLDHVGWLVEYFERHHRDPHTIASTLGGLERTLDVDPAKGILATALRTFT
jgi:hypothetical protein